MQVAEPNDVKIYNLSAGRSLPEWLSERKRRALLKKNVDIRRRIELIQDFDMPGVSTTMRVSKDGNYIMATGIYKPRVKCYDVNNLSLKFDRCFDSEAVTFEILTDDYSKMVFLQCDRYIELHAAYGKHYRFRIPKYGRDMKYHYPSCDLFVVGSSTDIYRFNLEQGRFMTPYTSQASAINKCEINPEHGLFICGTQEGRIEAWDQRVNGRIGILDCAFSCVNETRELKTFPSITALKFNGWTQMAVGTASGHVLLYDIRSDKPYTVKDHMNDLPIKNVEFHYQQDLMFSLDSSVVKIWDKNNGKPYTSIEASSDFNDLCLVPKTGLFFMANESTKMQTYFIPSMGPAPKWASFLDSLTEELEESNAETIYDDYKFVTTEELEALGLDHLIGTRLIRAYMHGYFMDVRLYKKAKSVAEPFEFEKYRKRKIRETIEQERESRIQLEKLPKVNKDLALKLMDDQSSKNKKKKESAGLLKDSRFKLLFENPDFEVDKNAEEYRLLNPVLSRLDKTKKMELMRTVSQAFEPVEEELEGKNSSEESEDELEDEDSSDDEHTWTKEVKKQHRIIQREHRERERAEEREKEQEVKQPKMFEFKDGVNSLTGKISRAALGDRVKNEDYSVKYLSTGSRQMTFSLRAKKRENRMEEKNKKHREERKKLIRPGFVVKSNQKKQFTKR